MIVESKTGNRYRILEITICESKCFYIKVTERRFQMYKNSEIIIAIIPGDNRDGRRLLGVAI